MGHLKSTQNGKYEQLKKLSHLQRKNWMDHRQKNHHPRQRVHAAKVEEPLTDPKKRVRL